MVIGQKTILKINNSVNYNNSSSLVIHINENWVVFCLFNKTRLIDLNKVNFLHVKKSTFILKTIKKLKLNIIDMDKAIQMVALEGLNDVVPRFHTIGIDNKLAKNYFYDFKKI